MDSGSVCTVKCVHATHTSASSPRPDLTTGPACKLGSGPNASARLLSTMVFVDRPKKKISRGPTGGRHFELGSHPQHCVAPNSHYWPSKIPGTISQTCLSYVKVEPELVVGSLSLL